MPKSTETSADRTVAPKQLISLIHDATQKKARIQSIAGELGERVKNAVENGHLHRGTFSLTVKLAKLAELKREDFIRQIALYVDICRVEGLFKPEHVSDLVEQAEGGGADDGDDGDIRPGFLQRREDKRAADHEADSAEANGAALADGIKPLAPRGEKGALAGADAAGGTRVQ